MLCILYSVFCILCFVFCILYSVFCILYLYSVFCILLYLFCINTFLSLSLNPRSLKFISFYHVSLDAVSPYTTLKYPVPSSFSPVKLLSSFLSINFDETPFLSGFILYLEPSNPKLIQPLKENQYFRNDDYLREEQDGYLGWRRMKQIRPPLRSFRSSSWPTPWSRTS